MSPLPLGIIASAGGVITSFDFLQTTTLSSSSSSISFTGLSSYSDYKHLELMLSIRGDGGNQTMIQFNGDTASNYRYFRMQGVGTSVNQEAALNDSALYIYHGLSANIFANYVISILDFNNPNKHKGLMALGGRVGTSPRSSIESQRWRSNNAITSITIAPSGGYNFVAGSSFSLCGVK